jgi:hypothetical protein
MRILIACEYSGRVREAFRKLGHDAWSCDLLPSDDNSPYHITGDVIPLLTQGWDMMIAHPPCTYLANSGVGRLYSQPLRWQQLIEGAVFFRTLLNAPIPLKAIENPIMHKYARTIIGGGPTQMIQPWQFGEDASKATCLWLVNLPKLEPTNIIKKARYANQTPSGQNKLGPSADRWKLRSYTYQGIADAMADQWGR